MSRNDRAAPRKHSELAAAAAALEAELERFEEAAASLTQSPLNSHEAIDARAADHEALANRFRALGEEARGIHALVQEVTSAVAPPTTPERLASLIARLEEIVGRMDAAVDVAQGVSREARSADFVDVERQADALRQQLLSARNRVGLLRRGLSS